MRRVTWRLTCTRKKSINLKDFEKQIIVIVRRFGGRNVIVDVQSFSFDWNFKKTMTRGQKAELGRQLAKIKGLGCYVDVYYYIRKNSNRSAVSRQLFRVA